MRERDSVAGKVLIILAVILFAVIIFATNQPLP